MMTKIDIRFSRYFLRNVKQLLKTSSQVIDRVESFADQLRQGEKPGDQIPGIGYPVYKARLSSGQKGKRGGYRIVYYIHLPAQILLIAIYMKARQENISPEVLRRIIEEELPDLDS